MADSKTSVPDVFSVSKTKNPIFANLTSINLIHLYFIDKDNLGGGANETRFVLYCTWA